MKLSIEFVPYILDQRANEIAVFLEKNEEEKEEEKQKLSLAMLHEVIEVITSYTTPGSEVTWLATMSFRKVKQLLGKDDPYETYKLMDLRLAREILKTYEKNLKNNEVNPLERLEKLLYLATAANAINSIYAGTEGFARSLASGVDNPVIRGFNPDRFASEVRGKQVAYVVNSLAELVFDTKVMSLLLEEFDVSDIIVYVKTEAYTNDATYNDLIEHVELPGQVDIMRMETDAAGVDRNLSPRQVLKSLMGADIIISKGLMNYCGFTNLERKNGSGDKKDRKNGKNGRKHEKKSTPEKTIPVYAFYLVRSAPVARRLNAVHDTPLARRLEVALP